MARQHQLVILARHKVVICWAREAVQEHVQQIRQTLRSGRTPAHAAGDWGLVGNARAGALKVWAPAGRWPEQEQLSKEGHTWSVSQNRLLEPPKRSRALTVAQ